MPADASIAYPIPVISDHCMYPDTLQSVLQVANHMKLGVLTVE